MSHDALKFREEQLQIQLERHEQLKGTHFKIALVVGSLAALGMVGYDIMTVGDLQISGGVSPSYGYETPKTPAEHFFWGSVYFAVGFGGVFGFLRQKPDADKSWV